MSAPTLQELSHFLGLGSDKPYRRKGCGRPTAAESAEICPACGTGMIYGGECDSCEPVDQFEAIMRGGGR